MGRLTAEMIALLGMGVAHQVGACTAGGRPVLCRGLAATLEDDGRLAMILSGESGFEVIDAVRETAWVAVNFTLPASYRSLHLKGRDAVVSVGERRYRDLVDARHRGFRDQLSAFGFPPAYTTAWYDVPDDELIAIHFTPIGAWNQTPGPGAGDVLDLTA